MTRFRLTPAAQQDLSKIWDFAQERWDDIRAGYRRYAIGSHLVFYVETEDTVDVIRLLHQRLDPSRHL